MTITRSATSHELTCEEIHTGFDALIERIADLAAQRDIACQMASQATKDLVRVRDEKQAMQAQLDLRDALIESLRLSDDRKTGDLRHLTARVHELALANEELQRQRERDQQEPAATRKSWLSRRIGNSL